MVQVIAKQLDDKSLILENPENGETLTWPIDQLTEPLEIGDKITLRLSNESVSRFKKAARDQNTKSADTQTEERRKLLEQLVN